jgi:chromate transporter
MEDELVRRRRWLSRKRFLDLLGASNLIPGPSSSEVAIHIGYLCAGWRGLLIAGSCFILPAAVMVAGLGWLYVHFGKLPAIAGVLYEIKPVVIGVVFQALWSLGRTAVKTTFLGFVAVLSLPLAIFGLHPLLLLLLAGGVACASTLRTSRVSLSVLSSVTVGSGTVATASFSLISLFLVFLKLGATVFGSGYVLLAFLRADLVTHRGWLTDSQLVDAVARGQVTPGPVFTTATFIGFILGEFLVLSFPLWPSSFLRFY